MSGARGGPGAEEYLAVLEAFAVGDALGAPTEFMTPGEIRAAGLAGDDGLVAGIVEPSASKNHPDLERARVTDDTEQNLRLVAAFLEAGRIEAGDCARALLAWARESGAEEKRYIGPSSLRALKAIEAGAGVDGAGAGGTTCGAVMRAPAATLCALALGVDLADAVRETCRPTHDSSPALEGATAYAFALRAALESRGGDPGEVLSRAIDEALRGAAIGLRAAPYEACAASTAGRIRHLRSLAPGFAGHGELLDFLYGVYGTGLESPDVASAAFGVAMLAKDDAWLAIRMGASVGGDTDTIAALAGALCAAVAGGHSIPRDIVREVVSANALDLGAVAAALARGTRAP